MSQAIPVGFGPIKVRITELDKEFDLQRIRVKHVQQVEEARATLQAALAEGNGKTAEIQETLHWMARLVVPTLTDDEFQELELETINQLIDLATKDAGDLRKLLKGTAPETTAPASS